MGILDYVGLYLLIGLVLYLFDEFDNETDTREFNMRDAIAFTLLGAAIKAKNVFMAVKGAVVGYKGKGGIGLVQYVRAIFARHFKGGDRG